jgi:hypothetical protein
MEMGTQYQSLLFYCNSCWLSRGNAVACVYNLQVAAALSLEEENLVHAEQALSEGLNRVGVFPHLRTETDPVSETLFFLVSRILEDGQNPKTSNSKRYES